MVNSTSIQSVKRLALVAAAVALISGCSATQPYSSSSYHAEREAELTALETFNRCEQDALAMDRSAREQRSVAQYLSAARSMDFCLAELEPFGSAVEQDQKMRLHALSILGFIKGGDLAQAEVQLNQFESLYAGRDLLLADHTSFLDSVSVLLDRVPKDARPGELLNVNRVLLAELQRRQYWMQN